MTDFQMNRRQALIASGLGALSMGLPGAVLGTDKVDAEGNATRSEKSCIFVLLCGGPAKLPLLSQPLEEERPVGEPGQHVVRRVMAQALLQALADRDVGHRADDPAHLPRLVEHRPALREQARRRR